MSRSSEAYMEEMERQQEFDMSSIAYEEWVRDMQILANSIKDKTCPFCQKKSCLEPTGIDEFICSKCNGTGAINGIL